MHNFYVFRSSSGSLAMLAAMRRASSRVSSFAAETQKLASQDHTLRTYQARDKTRSS